MKGRKIWLLAAVCFLLLACACFFYVWKQEKEKEDTAQMYEELRQSVKEEPEETPQAEEDEEDQSPQETKEPLSIPVDFEELQKVNPEIYAWITIPDTVIDYPIVQSQEDDGKYLTTSAEGTSSVSGAIFTEKANAKDFSDPHTVIYGHNMKDGSMFAGLHQYQDETFFWAHRQITIYTPDAIRTYQVFAAYVYDDRHLLNSFDCSKKKVYKKYLEEIQTQRNMQANLDPDTEVTTKDRIITLSTCYGSSQRYLVQAVLISEEK